MAKKRLGEILIEKGLITEQQLREALDIQASSKEYLGSIFVKRNMVSEKDLMRALSEQFGIPLVSLKNLKIDWDVCVRYYNSVTAQQKALPIHQDEDNVVVAIRDPLDLISLGSIEETIRPKKIQLVLVCESELEDFIAEVRRRSRSQMKGLLE